MNLVTLPNGKTVNTDVRRMDWPHSGLTQTVDGEIRIDEQGYVWLKSDVFDLPDNTPGKVGLHVIYRPCNPDYCPDTPGWIVAVVTAVYEAASALSAAERKAAAEAGAAEVQAILAARAAMPDRVKKLIAKYGTSERAWEAEDEEAWATLSSNGY